MKRLGRANGSAAAWPASSQASASQRRPPGASWADGPATRPARSTSSASSAISHVGCAADAVPSDGSPAPVATLAIASRKNRSMAACRSSSFRAFSSSGAGRRPRPVSALASRPRPRAGSVPEAPATASRARRLRVVFEPATPCRQVSIVGVLPARAGDDREPAGQVRRQLADAVDRLAASQPQDEWQRECRAPRVGAGAARRGTSARRASPTGTTPATDRGRSSGRPRPPRQTGPRRTSASPRDRRSARSPGPAQWPPQGRPDPCWPPPRRTARRTRRCRRRRPTES